MDANHLKPSARSGRRTDKKENFAMWLPPQASSRQRDADVQHRSTAAPRPSSTADWRDARYQAFALLRIAFTVAPIAFGLDKFFNVMVDWPIYLAPWINDIAPGTGQEFMYFVGVTEILAGIVVALKPRYGAYVVAAWLAGIVINLLTSSGFYDIALRDFGLMLARPHARPPRLGLRPAAATWPPLTACDTSGCRPVRTRSRVMDHVLLHAATARFREELTDIGPASRSPPWRTRGRRRAVRSGSFNRDGVTESRRLGGGPHGPQYQTGTGWI